MANLIAISTILQQNIALHRKSFNFDRLTHIREKRSSREDARNYQKQKPTYTVQPVRHVISQRRIYNPIPIIVPLR